jgi:hypothetical protein
VQRSKHILNVIEAHFPEAISHFLRQTIGRLTYELCAKLGDGHVREAAYRGG